jgi:hypothetical protein
VSDPQRTRENEKDTSIASPSLPPTKTSITTNSETNNNATTEASVEAITEANTKPSTAATAIELIFQCPHLLCAIARYADRTTLLNCLRVNSRLHLAAARTLYHTVRIDGDNMEAFFRGALIGTGVNEVFDCGFLTRHVPCEVLEKLRKDKAEAKAKSKAEVKAMAGAMRDGGEADSDYNDRDADSIPDLVDFVNNLQGGGCSGGGGPSSSATPSTTIRPAKKAKKKTKHPGNKKCKGNKKRSKKSKYASSKAPTPPTEAAPKINFKAPLFKYVRVLTVGSHHGCLCDLYGPHVAQLFTQLEILRLVPDFMFMFTLKCLCDNDGRLCPFFGALDARKIVFRNLDGSGPPSGWFSDEWDVPSLEEVVYFFPVDGRRYHCEDMYANVGLIDLGSCFEAVPAVTVVFCPDWDGTDELDTSFSFLYGVAHITLDDIVYPLSHLIMYLNTTYTIYGLETVPFAEGGDLCHVYHHFFPHQRLTAKVLQDAARHEIRCATLSANVLGYHDGKDIPYETDFEELVVYHTYAEYLKDSKNHRSELNDDD